MQISPRWWFLERLWGDHCCAWRWLSMCVKRALWGFLPIIGCLWTERPFLWIKVSFWIWFAYLHLCVFASLPIWFASLRISVRVWLLRGLLGMQKGEELKSLFLWVVLPWVPLTQCDADLGGSYFHRPRSQLCSLAREQDLRGIRKRHPWNSRHFLFLGPVQGTWRDIHQQEHFIYLLIRLWTLGWWLFWVRLLCPWTYQCLSLRFQFLCVYTEERVAGPHGNSVFSFVRSHNTVLQG